MIIIIQIQNMNIKLTMKDVNKILAKAHFKCKYLKKWCEKKVSLSCLHFSLLFSEGEVKSAYFLQVWWALLRGEATNTNFIVFGLTQSRLEPTIYRTWGEHANHYTTDAVFNFRTIEFIYFAINIRLSIMIVF